MVFKILAILIFLFGLATEYVGVNSFLLVERSVAMLQIMRDGGSDSLADADLSTFRIILYVNAILMSVLGLLSLVSSIGIFLKRAWGRSLWAVTLILIAVWMTYSIVMSIANGAMAVSDTTSYLVTLLLLAVLFYFFSRKKTRSYFEVK